MITFIDLFSGIGGFRLGMEQAGHKCLGHCEIDKFANASYKAMHNPREDEWFATDIRAVRANDIPRCDCWCFGFPCQDISVAGKQLGFDGKRSSLFFTVTRIIRDTKEENRPTYLFIENVKNLLSVNGGADFLKLLIELDETGYDAEWQVLNSKDFRVPQNRERVFIIGHLRGRGGREVFPIGESNSKVIKQISGGNQSERIFAAEGLSPCLDTMRGGNKQPKVLLIGKDGKEKKKDYASCLTGGGHSGGNHSDMDLLVQAVLTPDRAEKRQNGRRFKEDGEPMFTLTGQDRHGVMIYQTPRGNNDGGFKKIAPTLTKNSYEHNNHLIQDTRIRRLTPLECFRLQGFPDEYFYRAQSVNSDSQLYKQAGNSVTVTVIYEIAKRLENIK